LIHVLDIKRSPIHCRISTSKQDFQVDTISNAVKQISRLEKRFHAKTTLKRNKPPQEKFLKTKSKSMITKNTKSVVYISLLREKKTRTKIKTKTEIEEATI
jgi:hypothetical protein